jgi:CsoR family transcriptional regulator, copper-sensing transcriptional repressor
MSGHKRSEAATRLARADGHLHAVMKMVEEGREYREIVRQVAAVRSSLHGVMQLIVDDLVEDCVGSVTGRRATKTTLLELRDVIAVAQ